MKRYPQILAALTALALCTGCAAGGTDTPAAENTATVLASDLTGEETSAELLSTTVAASELFTDRDYETGYSDYVTITLSDSGSSADGSGVTIDGNTVNITESGTYLITGTLTDGQIRVELADDEKAQLVLDNASVTCQNSAALYIVSGDKVFLTTTEHSGNLLRSEGEFVQTDDNNVDGAIFSKSVLTLNGSGTLTVQSETGHGVVVKDDLKITSGTYLIEAARDGIQAKDSIRIADGSISIQSGSDGMQTTSEDEEKGYLYIGSGTINIVCENDGLQASSYLLVEDGEITVTAGGGRASAPVKTGFWDAPNRNQFENENAWEESETDTEESDSQKGLKAETAITVSGGVLTLDTADDAVHSNGDVTITGGTLTISSGDDGVHGDSALTISGGTLDVEAYEGLEALNITITGGDVTVVADNDGINASGGSSATLLISGGVTRINSTGDSVDSNGDLLVTGGEIYLTGPQGAGDGTLDYDGSGSITGGTVLATGTTGMEINFDQSSTQGSILYNLSATQSAGSAVTLTDASGHVVAEYTAEEDFNVVLISTPEITSGETYTMTAGTETAEIEMTSLIYGAGSSFGGGSGMGSDFGFGGKPAMGADSDFGGRPAMGSDSDFGGRPDMGSDSDFGGRPDMDSDSGFAPGGGPDLGSDSNFPERPDMGSDSGFAPNGGRGGRGAA